MIVEKKLRILMMPKTFEVFVHNRGILGKKNRVRTMLSPWVGIQYPENSGKGVEPTVLPLTHTRNSIGAHKERRHDVRQDACLEATRVQNLKNYSVTISTTTTYRIIYTTGVSEGVIPPATRAQGGGGDIRRNPRYHSPSSTHRKNRT